MARRKGKSRSRNNGIKLPLAVLAGGGVGVYNLVKKYFNWEGLSGGGGFGNVMAEFSRIYFGYSYVDPPQYGYLNAPGFNVAYLRYGLLPLLGGLFVHWFVGGKLGLNRALSRAKIPILRL